MFFFIVNFEHISHLFLAFSIINFEQVNVGSEGMRVTGNLGETTQLLLRQIFSQIRPHLLKCHKDIMQYLIAEKSV